MARYINYIMLSHYAYTIEQHYQLQNDNYILPNTYFTTLALAWFSLIKSLSI